jgi:hypothetical protein
MISLVVLVAGIVVSGCGGSDDTVDPLLRNVDKATDAQALSSLQQGLTTAALIRTEGGGSYGGSGEDLVRRLQARDGSKRYSTAPSNGPEEIQVLGGGNGAVMLVARSPSKAYLAIWDDGSGTTLYYRAAEPPVFTGQAPGGSGWTTTPLG